MEKIRKKGGSRPARARGLKRNFAVSGNAGGFVAPRAGAWIETLFNEFKDAHTEGRAPRGRVD